MHGFPCAALQHCFGSHADITAEPASSPTAGPSGVRAGSVVHATVTVQPGANGLREQHALSSVPEQIRILNSTNSNSNGARADGDHAPQVSFSCRRFSKYPEDDVQEGSPPLGPVYPHIPRPSIIRHPKDSPLQEGLSGEADCEKMGDETLSDLYGDEAERTEGLSRERSIMAEPDYLDGDCDELIKPKKLVNPVKTSRNHQDLHRELLMNQKCGLAPQNKPELQKVMEKRKRDQVLKQQKEEQEAHKKRSDLEIELMKRQQKLEQLELEQQKCLEEQENTPEFVKMKGNLRRTRQEAEPQEHAP